MKNMGNSFDERAQDWDANPVRVEISRIFVEEIAKHAPVSSDMTVLDFGCGTGLVGMRLQPFAKSVIMLDSSQGMLDVLKTKIEQAGINNIEVICRDIHKLNLSKRRIDLVCAMMVLHHVPDTIRLLKRLHHFLKPGGRLCVGDLEPEDGSFHAEGVEAHHGFDSTTLKKTVKASGFGFVDIHRMHIISKPDKNGTLRKYPLFFMKAVNR